MEAAALDLRRRRDVVDIVIDAFDLYRRRPLLFATMALGVVVPVDVLVYGVLGEQLWRPTGIDEPLPLGGEIASFIVPWLVTTPLITAGHVHALVELGAGRRPSALRSLGAAAKRLPAVAGVVVLGALGTGLGLLLLVVPGVFLWARWFVAPQSVMVDSGGPLAGLRHSAELVSGRWWRVFGVALAITIVAVLTAALLAVPLQLLADDAGSCPLQLLSTILAEAICLSYGALAGTLLFFDLRGRARTGLGTGSR